MKMLKRIISHLVIMLAILIPVANGAESKTGQEQIIIDVRTEAEWTTGHLEGAVLIPFERIGEAISVVTADKKAKIYLYCRTGRRTGIAFDTLKKAGYENLINLETVENAAKVLGRNVVK